MKEGGDSAFTLTHHHGVFSPRSHAAVAEHRTEGDIDSIARNKRVSHKGFFSAAQRAHSLQLVFFCNLASSPVNYSIKMPQVLRLDDGDARIQYGPPEAWGAVVNSGQEWNKDGTYHRAGAAGAGLFFLFRGRLFHLAILVQVFHMTPSTSNRYWNFSLRSVRNRWSISRTTTRREGNKGPPK